MSGGEVLKRGWLAGKTTLRITSAFGRRGNRQHEGVDISVPIGTVIYAPINGTLISKRQAGGKGYGTYLLLKSGQTTLLFGHLNGTNGLHEGSSKSVKQGQIIGYTGNSGNSTGAHLHFEYRLSRIAVNPLNYISDRCVNAYTGATMRTERTYQASVTNSGKVGKVVDGASYKSPKTFAISLYYFYYTATKNAVVSRFLVCQDAQESGYGKKPAVPFNFGGLRKKTKTGYKYIPFSSVQGYVACKLSNMRSKWRSSLSATTLESFVAGLYPTGGYNYSETPRETYLSKMQGTIKRVKRYIDSVSSFSFTDNDGNTYSELPNQQTKLIPMVDDPNAGYAYVYNDTDDVEEQNVDVSAESDEEPEEEDFGNKEIKTEDQKLAAGIWQIVRMAEDSEVSNLKLYDTSVGMQTGPLIGFFNRVCQQPLVEFSGDTFGDEYYFLVRRPPFDYDHLMKSLHILGIADSSVEEGNPYFIQKKDILRSNIVWNNANIYSWYQYFPIYEVGDAESMQWLTPAVFFPEFAAIWGSRSLSVRSQYRSFVNTDVYDNEKSVSRDETVSQVIKDMRYLIECNAYNAFVRRGSVTINGNRKIKRGTFVRLSLDDAGLDEIYFVESVSQSYNISLGGVSRTTTLQLSHGMVRNYIKKSKEEYVGASSPNWQPSYFNIINFGKKKNLKGLDNWREAIQDWKVNKDTFNFFLRRLQFIAY